MRSKAVLLVIGLGVALRILAIVASGPVALYLNDSHDYLVRSHHLVPDGYHPLGYPAFLAVLDASSHPLLLTWVQHGLGVATGCLVAWLALRLGLPGWGAALAAAPILLDPYVVIVEQTVVAETLFTLLLTVAVTLLLVAPRAGRRPLRRWIAAGLLVAVATLVRTAGLAVLAAIAVWLLVSRPGWRPAIAFGAAAVLPLLLYAGWFAARHGSPGLSQDGGIYLYGRLAPFTSCGPGDGLAARYQVLCDPRPVQQRPQPDYYLWQPGNPLKTLSSDAAVRATAATSTGKAMAGNDPGALVSSTVSYLWRDATFGPWFTRARRVDSTLVTWRADRRLSTKPAATDVRLSDGFRTVGHTTGWATTALRDYQRGIGAPMPLLVLFAGGGLIWAALLRWHAGTLLLFTAIAAALLVLPAVGVGWDVRFLIPALPFLGLAAVLGPAVVMSGGGPLTRSIRTGRSSW